MSCPLCGNGTQSGNFNFNQTIWHIYFLEINHIKIFFFLPIYLFKEQINSRREKNIPLCTQSTAKSACVCVYLNQLVSSMIVGLMPSPSPSDRGSNGL